MALPGFLGRAAPHPWAFSWMGSDWAPIEQGLPVFAAGSFVLFLWCKSAYTQILQTEKVRYVMASFEIGDLVVLTAGSMRMAIEAVDGEQVATVWCHEGEIGRDSFNVKLLKKWEMREEGGHRGGGKPYGGGRDGGSKPYGGRDRDGGRDDRPKGKPGWDGKPREKKFFRKD